VPRPCSVDWRGRVIGTVQAGASRREIVELFDLNPSAVMNWVKRYHETGSAAAKLCAGSVSPYHDWLLALLAEQPDERRWRFFERHDVTVKNNSLHATEQDREAVGKARRRWTRQQGLFDLTRLEFTNVYPMRGDRGPPRNRRRLKPAVQGSECRHGPIFAVVRPVANGTIIDDVADISRENRSPLGGSSCRLKVHRDAVDAIAQMRGRGAVVEDVAKVAPTTATVHLGANHPVAAVLGGFDRTLHRIVETRPTRSTLEFSLGREHRLTTSGTNEGAGTLLMIERTASRGFRAVCPHDLVLLRA